MRLTICYLVLSALLAAYVAYEARRPPEFPAGEPKLMVRYTAEATTKDEIVIALAPNDLAAFSALMAVGQASIAIYLLVQRRRRRGSAV